MFFFWSQNMFREIVSSSQPPSFFLLRLFFFYSTIRSLAKSASLNKTSNSSKASSSSLCSPGIPLAFSSTFRFLIALSLKYLNLSLTRLPVTLKSALSTVAFNDRAIFSQIIPLSHFLMVYRTVFRQIFRSLKNYLLSLSICLSYFSFPFSKNSFTTINKFPSSTTAKFVI